MTECVQSQVFKLRTFGKALWEDIDFEEMTITINHNLTDIDTSLEVPKLKASLEILVPVLSIQKLHESVDFIFIKGAFFLFVTVFQQDYIMTGIVTNKALFNSSAKDALDDDINLADGFRFQLLGLHNQ